jgi:hypothetical protein
MFVCCECCVLSGRGLCNGLITRPEESYRLWRVVMCDQETSKNEEAKARYRPVKNTTTMGCNARKTNKQCGIYDSTIFFVLGRTARDIINVYWSSCKVPVKADSHIACRSHAVPQPCCSLIHTCHAASLPCSDSAVSFVKVRVVVGNIRTASPAV